jgi:hypothetical protein
VRSDSGSSYRPTVAGEPLDENVGVGDSSSSWAWLVLPSMQALPEAGAGLASAFCRSYDERSRDAQRRFGYLFPPANASNVAPSAQGVGGSAKVDGIALGSAEGRCGGDRVR